MIWISISKLNILGAKILTVEYIFISFLHNLSFQNFEIYHKYVIKHVLLLHIIYVW